MFSMPKHVEVFYDRYIQWHDAGHKLKFTMMTRSGKPYWWCTQCDQPVNQTQVIEECKKNAIHITSHQENQG